MKHNDYFNFMSAIYYHSNRGFGNNIIYSIKSINAVKLFGPHYDT